jgi:hypothetical protein
MVNQCLFLVQNATMSSMALFSHMVTYIVQSRPWICRTENGWRQNNLGCQKILRRQSEFVSMISVTGNFFGNINYQAGLPYLSYSSAFFITFYG